VTVRENPDPDVEVEMDVTTRATKPTILASVPLTETTVVPIDTLLTMTEIVAEPGPNPVILVPDTDATFVLLLTMLLAMYSDTTSMMALLESYANTAEALTVVRWNPCLQFPPFKINQFGMG